MPLIYSWAEAMRSFTRNGVLSGCVRFGFASMGRAKLGPTPYSRPWVIDGMTPEAPFTVDIG